MARHLRRTGRRRDAGDVTVPGRPHAQLAARTELVDPEVGGARDGALVDERLVDEVAVLCRSDLDGELLELPRQAVPRSAGIGIDDGRRDDLDAGHEVAAAALPQDGLWSQVKDVDRRPGAPAGHERRLIESERDMDAIAIADRDRPRQRRR